MGLVLTGFSLNMMDSELALILIKKGGGPSLWTNPKWESQLAQTALYLCYENTILLSLESYSFRSVAPFLNSDLITLWLYYLIDESTSSTILRLSSWLPQNEQCPDSGKYLWA